MFYTLGRKHSLFWDQVCRLYEPVTTDININLHNASKKPANIFNMFGLLSKHVITSITAGFSPPFSISFLLWQPLELENTTVALVIAHRLG